MKNKIKISFIINSLYSGGAERVLVTLVNELSKLSYSIKLYTIQNENFYTLNDNISYFKLTNLKIKSNRLKFIIFYIFSFFKFFKIAKNDDSKVLISALDLSNILSILIWKKLLKRKVILWIHIDPLSQYKKGFYGFFFKTFIKFFYKFADKIVTVSLESREILIKNFKINENKVICIYNPFDIKKILNLSKEKIQKKEEKYFNNSFTFINIGRLSKQKGQWFLVRSFSEVVKKNKNAKLLIFGDGELKNDLKLLIKNLNLEKNIFLLGVRKNIFPYIKKSDCFVLSSLWEGLPTVLIENLALSKLCISTDCKTGPFEIFEKRIKKDNEIINYPYYAKYGILINNFKSEFCFKTIKEKNLSYEEKELANLLIKVMNDKEIIKKYSIGLTRAKDFEINFIIKKWDKLFDEILNN